MVVLYLVLQYFGAEGRGAEGRRPRIRAEGRGKQTPCKKWFCKIHMKTPVPEYLFHCKISKKPFLQDASRWLLLIRSKGYLSFNGKRVLISNYIISNLITMLVILCCKALNKIQSLQKRVLNHYTVRHEGLLEKSRKGENENLRILCVETNKTVNKLNPAFMINIFKVDENNRLVREKCKLNLETLERSQVTLGAKSVKMNGSKIWKFPITLNRLKI